MANPEQQGLKPVSQQSCFLIAIALMANPEQQGLKRGTGQNPAKNLGGLNG